MNANWWLDAALAFDTRELLVQGPSLNPQDFRGSGFVAPAVVKHPEDLAPFDVVQFLADLFSNILSKGTSEQGSECG